jgi:ribosomal protein S15
VLAAIRRARYRGINTDKSKVAQFKRDDVDTGSSEVQIAQLTARVQQLTAHLQEHRKDYASTRGLMKVATICS